MDSIAMRIGYVLMTVGGIALVIGIGAILLAWAGWYLQELCDQVKEWRKR